MKVLDLFSGLGGASQAFVDRGHFVVRVDNNTAYANVPHTLIQDTRHLHLPDDFLPDTVWASPPCEAFSVASIGHHWGGGRKAYVPKTDKAVVAMELVKETLDIIRVLRPALWFVENPRGILRKLSFMKAYPRHTITYCQYGDTRMKPTDIWSNSKRWRPRIMCKNGDPCHERAPRGSKTGTQGIKTRAERARIPYELSMEICLACEQELVG